MKKFVQSIMRIVLALLAGSLVSIVPVLIFVFNDAPSTDWFVLGLLFAGPVYFVISFFFLLVIMLPTHLLLLKKMAASWWLYASFGLIFAIGMGLAFDLFTGGWSPRREYVFFGALGLIVSIPFWYVLNRRTMPSVALERGRSPVGRE